MHNLLRQNLRCPVQGQYLLSSLFVRDLKLIYICQTVDGLSSVSLSRSNSKTIKDRIYTGNDCEWIDLNKVG